MQPFMEQFDEIQTQFTRWWQRENTRPLLYAPAHWPRRAQLPPPSADPRDHYFDAPTIARQYAAMARLTAPGGVYFPHCCPLLPTAAFFGATPTFTHGTIWHQPTLDGDAPYADLHFDPANPYFRAVMAMYEQLVELADGQFYLSLPNCYSPLDLLEALRGGTRLSMDLLDRPDEVKAAQAVILDAWRTIYDLGYSLHQRRFDGTAPSFLQAWAPGRSFALQCDFCCNISASMFEEFVVPEVVAQAHYVDFSLFHLDGPGAARHAALLLDIPELDGIQWQKGINGGATLDWLPLLEQIQRAGKCLMVDGSHADVLVLADKLAPEGLFLATACDTPEESQELQRRIGG